MYELAPNPVVLFNLGLVYAAMGRPVDAVDALDRVIADPGTLPRDRLDRARIVRATQAARVGSVAVSVDVGPATIEVDAVEVAKTPLARPLDLASGAHIIGAIAPGYAPARREVLVAGGTTTVLRLELVPIPGRLAHLDIKTHLPAATVTVDGTSVGHTPLAASITVPPGSHRVEVVRPGYVTAGQDILLGEGATGEISLDPELDLRALDRGGATLVLDISQPQGVVTVDGKTLGAYNSSIRIPAGVHRLRVEHAGYLAYERDVDLPEGHTTAFRVDLFPTPETLASYTAFARLHRNGGWISVVVGTALAGGAAGYLLYNAGPTNTTQAKYNALELAVINGTPPCNTLGKTAPIVDTRTTCNAAVTTAYNNYQSDRIGNDVGYVVGGVGLVTIGIGLALLLTGDDLHRYNQKTSGELFVGAGRLPVPWSMLDRGGFLWRGSF